MCVEERCQPETLAVVPNPPSEITLDGGDLVFATGGVATSSGVLYRLAKTGGAPQVLYRGLGAQPALAVASQAILVADSGLPDACRLSGSAGAILSVSGDATTLVSMGRHCARSLIPFDGALTWLEDEPTTFFESDDPLPWIARLPDGAAPDAPPAVVYSDPQFGTLDLIPYGSTLMWRGFSGNDPALFQMPIAGGTPHVVVSIPGGANPFLTGLLMFAANETQLVYVGHSAMEFGNHVVLRSLATGAETTLADVDGEVQQIAFDASFVYWIAGGNVWALDLASRKRAQLTDDGTGLHLVQDDRYLYTLQRSTRAMPQTNVSRVRKPAPIAQDLFGFSRECVAPLMQCSTDPFSIGPCVDVTQDPNHCGNCMTACGRAESCTSGVCTCAAPSMVCGTGCVDLASDGANCGHCGRSCGAGACRGGDCTPAQIGEFAQAAAQDAGVLYYAVGKAVKRLDKQSFGVTTLGQFAYARDLTIDAARLYVVETSGGVGSTNPGTIHAVARDGSVATPLYRNRPNPRQIAVANGEVLWVEDAGDVTSFPSTLVHAAVNGSAILGSLRPTGLYPGAEDDESRDIAVDGSVVYWLLGDGNQRSGAILRLDLNAAAPSLALLTTLDRDPAALTIVNGKLYVTTRGSDGVLLSLPAMGGATSVLAAGLFDAGTIESTTDGSVYWLDGDFDGRIIHQLAPGAATSRTIGSANTQDAATLLFDGDRLYTASSNGIFVMTR
ncbi:MAG: hypothetical protein E6J90_16005 [Deltaproteobacteria bacterium]|nr:MAG: hypothetical protein E6J91_31500 [Deltaproteobacteria bacterium]TMQ20500.1 MAG: hypothetical protein E6J90_16005 [Deltaproteobacteria bacterium]